MTEKFTIQITRPQLLTLNNLLVAFELGYIANQAKWAERDRMKYEKLVRAMVEQVP